MKKIIQFIKNLFKGKREKTLEKACEQLDDVLFKRTLERIKLKKDINTFLRRYLRLKSMSDFIPRQKVSKISAIKAVEARYGKEMKSLGIRIRTDLSLTEK